MLKTCSGERSRSHLFKTSIRSKIPSLHFENGPLEVIDPKKSFQKMSKFFRKIEKKWKTLKKHWKIEDEKSNCLAKNHDFFDSKKSHFSNFQIFRFFKIFEFWIFRNLDFSKNNRKTNFSKSKFAFCKLSILNQYVSNFQPLTPSRSHVRKVNVLKFLDFGVFSQRYSNVNRLYPVEFSWKSRSSRQLRPNWSPKIKSRIAF